MKRLKNGSNGIMGGRMVDRYRGIKKPLCRSGYLYIFGKSGGSKKIGYTENPPRRIKELSKQNPGAVIFGLIQVERFAARMIEQETHKILEKYHVKGEWFNVELDVINDAIKEATYAKMAEIINFERAHGP